MGADLAMTKPETKPKIPLSEWGRRNYARAPHINTLRRWAKDGLIKPKPQKHGRSYAVDPDATYVAAP